MRISEKTLRVASAALAFLGVLAGVFGAVRFASLALALATAGTAYQWRHSARRIDFYLPMALAVGLFALAIALPRGR